VTSLAPLAAITAITVIAIAAGACSNAQIPTSPTTTTTTTTTAVADPAITEEFGTTVPVGGARFYSFTVAENGTVRVRLTQVGGPNVAPTLWLGLGLGTPDGEDCVTTTSLNTQASETAQISGTYAAGIYCARVYDIGNLIAPASVYITIDHP
jgi:hypothetical protein